MYTYMYMYLYLYMYMYTYMYMYMLSTVICGFNFNLIRCMESEKECVHKHVGIPQHQELYILVVETWK